MNVETLQYTGETWSKPFPDSNSPQTLVLVFGASSYFDQQAPLRELAAHYKNSVVVGCSSAGEILKDEIYDNSLVVAVIEFAQTHLRMSVVTDMKVGAHAGGRALANGLKGPNLRAVLILSTGIDVNGSALVRGLGEDLGEVLIAGGLAGDDERFERTWIIAGSEMATQGAVAVGLYGEGLVVGYGSGGGWDIFGPEREVTKSKDNVLLTLNGQPALGLYKDYLGALSEGLPGAALRFPLAVGPLGEAKVVRTILAIDEETESMTFAGDIPSGEYAQLMRANIDRLVEGAALASSEATSRCADLPVMLCIAISCVGRRIVLSERCEEEVEAVADLLSAAITQIGFYSYGEISPGQDGRCTLHNQTMTLLLLGEVK